VYSADLGHHRHRNCRPDRPSVCRVPRQKTALKEASQGQGRQEGHERGDGRQGSSDVGSSDEQGT